MKLPMIPLCSLLASMSLSTLTLSAQEPGRPGPPHRGPHGDPHHAPQAKKKVTWLGVLPAPVHPQTRAQLGLGEGTGLAVIKVQDASPAASAGLKPHDILVKLDDQLVINPEQLRTLVLQKKEGDKVKLTVFREAKTQEIEVTLSQTEVPVVHERMRPPGRFAEHFRQWHRGGGDPRRGQFRRAGQEQRGPRTDKGDRDEQGDRGRRDGDRKDSRSGPGGDHGKPEGKHHDRGPEHRRDHDHGHGHSHQPEGPKDRPAPPAPTPPPAPVTPPPPPTTPQPPAPPAN